jgi:trehalose-phosphatase
VAGSEAKTGDLLAPLRSEPSSAAIVSDLDGTLAPIVARPEDAQVPLRPRELLAELADRFALVACVSGRRAADARSLVGLDELTYVGNHGFERLDPGEVEPTLLPELVDAEAKVERFASKHLDPAEVDAAGLRIEDKGPIRALHWRGAVAEAEAEASAREIAAAAEAEGLEARWGRKVLELRPPVDVDKGTALAALLRPARLTAALYAGDDRTDLDGFRALSAMREAGTLSATVSVGIAADESPAEIAAEADVVVADPPAFWAILGELAD